MSLQDKVEALEGFADYCDADYETVTNEVGGYSQTKYRAAVRTAGVFARRYADDLRAGRTPEPPSLARSAVGPSTLSPSTPAPSERAPSEGTR